MANRYRFLTDAQVEHFLTRGFIVIRNAFTREQAAPYTENLFERLGYDPHDKSTWKEGWQAIPHRHFFDAKAFAPKAWGAICELLGGEERIVLPCSWGDGFLVNLGRDGDEETWQPPSPAYERGVWHIDGNWFVHYLDSGDQGLLATVLWSDIQTRGGGTFVACDSVGPVARFLAQHPEGIRPKTDAYTPILKLIGQCTDCVEATGEVGDIFLMHPFTLHCASQNALRTPRLITNPAVCLKAPLNLNRADPEEFSLVERAILRGLGVDRYEFIPTGKREYVD